MKKLKTTELQWTKHRVTDKQRDITAFKVDLKIVFGVHREREKSKHKKIKIIYSAYASATEENFFIQFSTFAQGDFKKNISM